MHEIDKEDQNGTVLVNCAPTRKVEYSPEQKAFIRELAKRIISSEERNMATKFEEGKDYYFWNKHSDELDWVTVVAVYETYIVVEYKNVPDSCDSKRFKVSIDYASRKLFQNAEDLPGYHERVSVGEDPFSPENEEKSEGKQVESWDYYFNPDYDGEDYDE